MEIYGYKKIGDGYIITKNGEDYIRTTSEDEAKRIVELLRADNGQKD